jgi:hypothetical protein
MRTHAALNVIPFLDGCRLAETDRTVARNYITALQEEGRSANTIRQAEVVVLGVMFGMAATWASAAYTACMAGCQDKLAEISAARGWLLTPRRLAGSAAGVSDGTNVPGATSQAELVRVPGVTPGRARSLDSGGRKHPAAGRG